VAKERYLHLKIGEEDLPTASEDIRGQIRVKPHSIAEQGDRLMLCRLQDDGTTIAWANLTGMSVQKGDVTVGFGMLILDFSNDFTVTESPADEANIGIDLSGIRAKMVIPKSAAQSGADTASTTSTTVYQVAMQMQLVLPTEGTWSVVAMGGMQLRHSTGGDINFRLLINGWPSSVRTLSSSVNEQDMCDGTLNSIDAATLPGGIVNIFVEYKANTAGTVNAKNPHLFAIAVRTA
jgi:hypothetical protein